MLDLLKNQELHGKFWLTENDSNICYGKLTFNPQTYLELSLSPELRPIGPFTYTHTHPPKPMFSSVMGILDSGSFIVLDNIYFGGFKINKGWGYHKYVIYDPILISESKSLSNNHQLRSCTFELTNLRYWYQMIRFKLSYLIKNTSRM